MNGGGEDGRGQALKWGFGIVGTRQYTGNANAAELHRCTTSNARVHVAPQQHGTRGYEALVEKNALLHD